MIQPPEHSQPLPGLPRDVDGPVFTAPWQAQAFAMAMTLRDRGLFTWEEWAARLGAEIRRAPADDVADAGEAYYRHWLAALESLVVEKGAMAAAELAERRDAWDRAAHATPHGKPIELGAELT